MKRLITLLLLTSLLAGCRTSPPCQMMPQHNETMLLMMEAALYFTLLKEAGALPELQPKDHGQTQTMPVADPLQTAFYPFSAKLTSLVNGRDAVYWYIMTKQDPSAEWRVAKIWKTDKNNRLLADQLPLPSAAAQTAVNANLRMKVEAWKKAQ